MRVSDRYTILRTVQTISETNLGGSGAGHMGGGVKTLGTSSNMLWQVKKGRRGEREGDIVT